MIKSVNHLVICEPYKNNKAIKSKISHGVAVIQQKVGVVGLKVLKDAVIDDKLTIKAGSVVFIKEEILFTHNPYSQILECLDISEPFTLINFGHVVFVKDK